MLKPLVQDVLPPVLYRGLAAVKSGLFPKEIPADVLFDGDDRMFKQIVAGAGTYAEYGCGASTIWVTKNTDRDVLGVDTSRAWLDNVRHACPGASRLSLHHCDLGEVGAWGRPENYDHWDHFADYTDWVWQQPASPDVVLVDGRFRVCCFLTSLLNARPGTRILFDDYVNRPWYHFVERFAKREQVCGRQVLFVAPGRAALDVAAVGEAIEHFRFVMD